MSETVILIPTFNEIKSLTKILTKLSKLKFKILIVNDASTDNTKKYLNSCQISFIDNKSNIGYEASLIKGMSFIMKNFNKTKNIITFDADGEHKVSDLNKIVKFFSKNKLDLLICNRTNIQRFSEKIVNFFFNLKFKMYDPLSGLKVYKKTVLKKYLQKVQKNFFLVDLTVFICSNNYKVKNFPIKCNILKNRQPRIGNSLQANFKIFKILGKVISNDNK